MQKGFKLRERDFFKEPFSRKEIDTLLQGKPASAMFNFKSPGFKKLGLEAGNLSHDKLIGLMLEEPRFVKRPVAFINGTTYFGASKKVLEHEAGLV
ncbi:MAG: hypothetical protein JW954_08225 [Dehalococcoidaceae bacterium]|nr:hypothetical protein [Dehalococcoidaceae bacterium]